MQIGLQYVKSPPEPNCDIQEYKEGLKNWVYSVVGMNPQSYPCLKNEALLTELQLLAKGSLNLKEWMANDKKCNTPKTAPGMKRREKHIEKIFAMAATGDVP